MVRRRASAVSNYEATEHGLTLHQHVIARSEAERSNPLYRPRCSMDRFAEPVIGLAEGPDPAARNDD
jgi:hypothetical protein